MRRSYNGRSPDAEARAMNKTPHFTMIRGFHLADWFTLANSACGMGAVIGAMAYLQDGSLALFLGACALVPVALVFDILDGRIARW
jgi:CDP-diacylglycerol--serine O-phosphatidyltransferase